MTADQEVLEDEVPVVALSETAPTRGRVLPVALALVSASLLSPFLARRGVSRDEGATLYSSTLPLDQLAEQARVQDVVLVPYYLLQHLWLLVSDDLVWARLLSLLAYATTIYVTTRAAEHWVGARWALLAGLLTATNPRLIEEVFNARPYAPSAAAAAVALLGLTRLDRNLPRGGLLFGAGAVAAVALHQFAGLGPLCAVTVLALLRHWPWRRLLALLALPSLALLGAALLSLPQRGQLAWLDPLTPRIALETLLGGFGQRPLGGLPQALVVAGLLLLVVLFRRRVEVPTLVAGVWLVAPALLLVLASLASPVHGERYVTASAPALGVLVAVVSRDLVRTRARPLALLAVVLLLGVAAFTSARDVVRLPERSAGFGDVAAECAAGDVVAIPTHMAAGAFGQHLPQGLSYWPAVEAPYLEQFALDDRPSVISRAPELVTVCDLKRSFDTRDVAEFERALQRAGYRLEDRSEAEEVYVHTFRRP